MRKGTWGTVRGQTSGARVSRGWCASLTASAARLEWFKKLHGVTALHRGTSGPGRLSRAASK